MKKSLKLWQIGGFLFTSVSGTLLHFLYDWTKQSIIVAPFSAVNESTWEHMKLLFIPLFVFAFIENSYIGEKYDNYWCTKFIGTSAGLIIIPVMYYTYTGALGVSADWFNISIFYIAAAAVYYLETQLLKREISICKSQKVCLVVLCLIAVSFVVFTFVQPKIPLFKDPVTGQYGM